MPTPPAQTTCLPTTWSETLDGIQADLDKAIAAAVERERMLQSVAPSNEPVKDGDVSWQEHLQRLDEHLAQMEASSQRPAHSAREADEALAACEAAVKNWLAAAAANGQKLAKWAGGAV